MDLKFIQNDGKERSITTVVDMVGAIRSGAMTATSMLYDASTQKWIRADAHPEFVAIQSAPSAAWDVTEAKRIKRINRIGWLLFPAGIATIAFGSSIASLGAEKSGELIGQSIAYLMLAALLLFVILRKDKSAGNHAKRNLTAGMVYVGICVCVLLKGIWDKEQVRADTAALQARIDRLIDVQEKMTSGSATPKSVNDAPPQISEDQTPLQKVGTIIERATQRSLEITAVYHQALKDAKFDQLLSPRTLTSAHERASARARLKAVSSAISKFESDTRRSEQTTRAEIEGAGLQDTLQGFDKGSKARAKLQSEFVRVERDMVAAVDEMVTLAEMSHASVSVDGSKILFPTQNYLDRYSELLDKIKALAAEETSVQTRDLERMREVRDRLKSTPL